jgi:CelD/BcsL family acetyltransferase involved in cellulose biosynthesis
VSRPTAASRNAGLLVAEWRPLAALTPVVGEWRALAARALEPNAFYEPSFALAAAPVFGRDAGAVLVWLRDAPRQMLGFFPARIERRRYGVAKPVLVGWTHPYGPYGTPLVDRAAAEPAIDAWLAHVTRTASLPKLLLLPFIHDSGPFAAALDAVLSPRRIPAVDFDRHERALLALDAATVAPEAEAGAARANCLAHAVPGRRLKELRRLRRRLAETGELAFTTVRGVFGIDEALADFMTLEASGWKGRSRTATAHRHDIRRFVEIAVRGLAADGKARIDRMLLDGRTLAASVTLRSGDGAFFWKIAYDETFARYSPGVLLTLELTEQLLADDAIARTDSCATAGHPMIDRLWRERLPLVDRLIGLRPDAGLAVAKHLETSRRGIVTAAKRVRDLIRL